jgi:hypothetical protein
MIRESSSNFSEIRGSLLKKLNTNSRHILVNLLIKSERFDSGIQRDDSVVKTSPMKFERGGILRTILMQKV